jgi:hypothetical protein
MGYALVYGPCWSCRQPFAYHPNYVPSIFINRVTGQVDPINGVREPVCESCMKEVNEKRREMGMVPHHVHPKAYEPAREEELQW